MYKINYLNQKSSKLSVIHDDKGEIMTFETREQAATHKNSILTHKAVLDGFYDVVEIN